MQFVTLAPAGLNKKLAWSAPTDLQKFTYVCMYLQSGFASLISASQPSWTSHVCKHL